MEIRSADPTANPYLSFAFLIYAGIDGINKKMKRGEPMNVNLFTADASITDGLDRLPESLKEAQEISADSDFVKWVLAQ